MAGQPWGSVLIERYHRSFTLNNTGKCDRIFESVLCTLYTCKVFKNANSIAGELHVDSCRYRIMSVRGSMDQVCRVGPLRNNVAPVSGAYLTGEITILTIIINLARHMTQALYRDDRRCSRRGTYR